MVMMIEVYAMCKQVLLYPRDGGSMIFQNTSINVHDNIASKFRILRTTHTHLWAL